MHIVSGILAMQAFMLYGGQRLVVCLGTTVAPSVEKSSRLHIHVDSHLDTLLPSSSSSYFSFVCISFRLSRIALRYFSALDIGASYHSF